MNQMVTWSLQQQLDLEANCQGHEGKTEAIMKMEKSIQELQKPISESDVQEMNSKNKKKTCRI